MFRCTEGGGMQTCLGRDVEGKRTYYVVSQVESAWCCKKTWTAQMSAPAAVG